MKQFLFSACAAICLAFSANTYAQDQQAKTDTATAQTKKSMDKTTRKTHHAAHAAKGNEMQQNMSMAYTPTYSSQFAIGSPANSQLVLNLVKDYENNTFSMQNAFADTAMVIFPNGNMVRGANGMVEAIKKVRASVAEPKLSITAVMPVRSLDRKEDWVLVWGNGNTPDGNVDFHQIWRINKDGKVDYMQMFESHPPQQQADTTRQ